MLHADRTVGILHHTGGGDLGGDAIIDAVIGNIRRRWIGADILVFSINHEDTGKRLEVRSHTVRPNSWSIGYKARVQTDATSRKGLLQWLSRTRNPLVRLPRAVTRDLLFVINSYRSLRFCDLLVVSGGQVAEGGGPWSFPFALFIWTLLAKLMGIRCIFLNNGVEPFNDAVSRFLVKQSLSAADYVSFRDQQSRALAMNLGLTRPSRVFPDNVFSLEVEVPVGERARERTVVGIAPMPFRCGDLPGPPAHAQNIQDELIGKLASLTSLLAKESFTLQLFGSDAGADPPEIEHLRTVLQSRHGIALPEFEAIESVRELLSRIATMDYVVACRFHGVVFALLLNKPVLAISHHPEVTELMKTLGLSRYCVDLRTLDSWALADKFLSLVRESEGVRHRMSAGVTRFRSQLVAQFDDLFSPQMEPPVMHQIVPSRPEPAPAGQPHN